MASRDRVTQRVSRNHFEGMKEQNDEKQKGQKVIATDAWFDAGHIATAWVRRNTSRADIHAHSNPANRHPHTAQRDSTASHGHPNPLTDHDTSSHGQ